MHRQDLTYSKNKLYDQRMTIQKTFLWIFLIITTQSSCYPSILEQFKQVGYVEIRDDNHGTANFDALYAHFDALIEFFQKNPIWVQKLYSVKERFIRSKERTYYATDFFGFYDESRREGRNQISFYYSIHFHEFICTRYQEWNQIPEMIQFLDACREIQKPYGNLFSQAAGELDLKSIFSDHHAQPPILLKLVKYLPAYRASNPHYDGTAFSLFLDSTDNQSLLLCAYKSSFALNDFSSPIRKFSRDRNRNSILLIPGTLLAEFSIYPTPHIVLQSGNIRYATIAFAMRPNYIPQKIVFTELPSFKR